ncbi:MAG TPA: hypothetical protein VF712_19610 [Thermoleophilaceae bacterium]
MISGASTHAIRRSCGVALAIASALALAPAAQGATTIGSGLGARANLSIACGTPGEPESVCTTAQTELPDRPVTAPVDGVIVRFRLRSASAGTVRLRVLRPSGNGKFTGAGTSAPLSVSSVSSPGEDRSYFASVRLPVLQGDYIGLDRERRTGAIYAQRSGSAFDLMQFDVALADGDSEGPDGSYEGAELLLNADVEADRDGDGFGDESQDNCPSIANDQTDNPCPSDPIGPGDGDAGDPGSTDDDEGRQFRRHKAKKRKRKKRRGRRTTADRFQSHRGTR